MTGRVPLTGHQVAAALRVARLLDAAGNDRGDRSRTYRLALTDGAYSAQMLAQAEGLLVAVGLVAIKAGAARPTERLSAVCRLQNADAVAALWTLLARAVSGHEEEAERRAAVGADGEEAVVTACRDELLALGEPGLSSAVQRVSLIDDSFGYDVVAPTAFSGTRRLEVKTCSKATSGRLRVFLTRNELQAGVTAPADWALVVCLHDGDGARPLGWCRAASLEPYLPRDANGRWTEAVLTLPQALLNDGLPPAI